MAKTKPEAVTQEALTPETETQEAEAQEQLTPEEIDALVKTNAGKDRKITALTRELQQVETAANDDEIATRSERLREIGADLKARESELAAREKALNTAIEEGVPINLMLRGADDLDGTLAELKDYADTSYQRRRQPLVPNYSGQKPRLQQSHLAKMSVKELSNVPASVLDKVLQNGQ